MSKPHMVIINGNKCWVRFVARYRGNNDYEICNRDQQSARLTLSDDGQFTASESSLSAMGISAEQAQMAVMVFRRNERLNYLRWRKEMAHVFGPMPDDESRELEQATA